jgi:hypothetical protein
MSRSNWPLQASGRVCFSRASVLRKRRVADVDRIAGDSLRRRELWQLPNWLASCWIIELPGFPSLDGVRSVGDLKFAIIKRKRCLIRGESRF